jgi:hypothetical protein
MPTVSRTTRSVYELAVMAWTSTGARGMAEDGTASRRVSLSPYEARPRRGGALFSREAAQDVQVVAMLDRSRGAAVS